GAIPGLGAMPGLAAANEKQFLFCLVKLMTDPFNKGTGQGRPPSSYLAEVVQRKAR
ncbi:unnamed protein product, partial [marine sediment metagenome]